MLNLRYNVLDKFHHFHHFEFHQLFYVRIPCLNLGIESEHNKYIFYGEKSRV